MAKTKVKKDERGLFVRAGGYLFRPEHNKHTRTTYPMLGKNVLLSEGDEVDARHVAGTPLGKLKMPGYETYWFSHGTYTKGPTEKHWIALR